MVYHYSVVALRALDPTAKAMRKLRFKTTQQPDTVDPNVLKVIQDLKNVSNTHSKNIKHNIQVLKQHKGEMLVSLEEARNKYGEDKDRIEASNMKVYALNIKNNKLKQKLKEEMIIEEQFTRELEILTSSKQQTKVVASSIKNLKLAVEGLKVKIGSGLSAKSTDNKIVSVALRTDKDIRDIKPFNAKVESQIIPSSATLILSVRSPQKQDLIRKNSNEKISFGNFLKPAKLVRQQSVQETDIINTKDITNNSVDGIVSYLCGQRAEFAKYGIQIGDIVSEERGGWERISIKLTNPDNKVDGFGGFTTQECDAGGIKSLFGSAYKYTFGSTKKSYGTDSSQMLERFFKDMGFVVERKYEETQANIKLTIDGATKEIKKTLDQLPIRYGSVEILPKKTGAVDISFGLALPDSFNKGLELVKSNIRDIEKTSIAQLMPKELKDFITWSNGGMNCSIKELEQKLEQFSNEFDKWEKEITPKIADLEGAKSSTNAIIKDRSDQIRKIQSDIKENEMNQEVTSQKLVLFSNSKRNNEEQVKKLEKSVNDVEKLIGKEHSRARSIDAHNASIDMSKIANAKGLKRINSMPSLRAPVYIPRFATMNNVLLRDRNKQLVQKYSNTQKLARQVLTA